MDKSKYVSFDCSHSNTDKNNNLTFYIDGFPEDENEEGAVIATVTLTKSDDIYTDWHYNGYRFNDDVNRIIKNIINTSIPETIEKRNKDKRENKEQFLDALHKVLSTFSSEYAGIQEFRYVVDDNDNEWLYVIYDKDTQKRININADSCKAILEDFMNKLHTEEWLQEKHRVVL